MSVLSLKAAKAAAVALVAAAAALALPQSIPPADAMPRTGAHQAFTGGPSPEVHNVVLRNTVVRDHRQPTTKSLPGGVSVKDRPGRVYPQYGVPKSHRCNASAHGGGVCRDHRQRLY